MKISLHYIITNILSCKNCMYKYQQFKIFYYDKCNTVITKLQEFLINKENILKFEMIGNFYNHSSYIH